MNKVVKKLIFGIGIIGFIVFSINLIYIESYFPLYPAIDTVLPPGFNKNFHTITPGMSAAAVESLLGPPLREASIYREDLHTVFQQSSGVVNLCWQYGSDGAAWPLDFAWLSYNVCFDSEDQVIETGLAVYYD